MKKYIILLSSVLFLSLYANAQRIIGINKATLFEVTLNDSVFRNQLDSILFIKYSCRFSSEKTAQKYAYFARIEEVQSGYYNIVVIYAKLSVVEDDINTGIYVLKDCPIIIRESSEIPIFKLTGGKKVIYYEKEMTRKKENRGVWHYEEIVHPEEFCTWRLSYVEGQLKVLGSEYVNRPYEKPQMLEKIEPIRYH